MKPTTEQVMAWAIRCGDEWGATLPEDKKFIQDVAALAYAAGAEAMKERCAKVCSDVNEEYDGDAVSAGWIANAIRALGDNDE